MTANQFCKKHPPPVPLVFYARLDPGSFQRRQAFSSLQIYNSSKQGSDGWWLQGCFHIIHVRCYGGLQATSTASVRNRCVQVVSSRGVPPPCIYWNTPAWAIMAPLSMQYLAEDERRRRGGRTNGLIVQHLLGR